MTTSRNSPCSCGSGKKYKRCCLRLPAEPGTPPQGEVDDGSPDRRSRRSWVVWLAPLGLVAAGLLAYANSFQGAFVFDDWYLLENHKFRRLTGIFIKGSVRPLTDVTFAVNYALGQFAVEGYHLVNLLIHLAAALILYGLCRRTLTTDTLRPRCGPAATPLAFSSALLWLLHPLQTESVTYVIQRAEALMGCWALLTLYAVCRAQTSSHPRRWTIVAVTACAFGMLSKPVMVTIPILVLLYDRAFLAGSVRRALRVRRGLYLGLAATWGLLAILLTLNPPDPETTGFRIPTVKWTEYLATQPSVILYYLRLALWPHPLILDYDWPVARTLHAILWPALALGILFGVTISAWRQRSFFGFFGVAFFLLLAPTSSLIPIADLAVEHRMYLPLASVMIGGVCGIWWMLRRTLRSSRSRKWLSGILVCALAAVLAVLTIRRNQDYRNEVTVWADTVSQQPHNARAHNNLCRALQRRGKLQDAVAHCETALRLKADYLEARLNLGAALNAQQKFSDAIRQYTAALQLNPTDARVHNNLGFTQFRLNRVEEACAHYTEAIRLAPTYVTARLNYAKALDRLGHVNEMMSQCVEAVRLSPANAHAHLCLGHAFVRANRFEEAITQFETAFRLDPKDQMVRRTMEQIRATSIDSVRW